MKTWSVVTCRVGAILPMSVGAWAIGTMHMGMPSIAVGAAGIVLGGLLLVGSDWLQIKLKNEGAHDS